jgi:hypothetical protein
LDALSLLVTPADDGNSDVDGFVWGWDKREQIANFATPNRPPPRSPFGGQPPCVYLLFVEEDHVISDFFYYINATPTA